MLLVSIHGKFRVINKEMQKDLRLRLPVGVTVHYISVSCLVGGGGKGTFSG